MLGHVRVVDGENIQLPMRARRSGAQLALNGSCRPAIAGVRSRHIGCSESSIFVHGAVDVGASGRCAHNGERKSCGCYTALSGLADRPLSLATVRTDADPTRHLPVELIDNVLDYLPEANLHRVPGVSKRFRGVVKQDPRFVASLGVCFHGMSDYCAQLRTVLGVLSYAVPERLRISFTVECCCDYVQPLRDQFYHTLQDMVCNTLFGAISTAYPVMVRLSSVLPYQYQPALDDALIHQAPWLAALALAHDQYGTRTS